jgi:uncharacterized protein (TIGR02594 family)
MRGASMTLRGPGAYVKATPLMLAGRYLGVHERVGDQHNPQIQAWLQLSSGGVNSPAMPDEVPWCSSAVYAPAYELDLARPPRPALRARHWLIVGTTVKPENAIAGFDVVVLKRGSGPQPGADILDAQGHVGFFVRWEGSTVVVVRGGNQNDALTDAGFPASRILGIRRL